MAESPTEIFEDGPPPARSGPDRAIHLSDLIRFMTAELLRTAPDFDPSERQASFDRLVGHGATRRFATRIIEHFDARTELDVVLETAQLDDKLDRWFKGDDT